MKRLFVIIVALLSFPLAYFPASRFPFSSSYVVAQTGEVDVLVKRIEARYGRMSGLAAEFEQVYSAPGGRERRESGRLFLARPRRMRWEYAGKLFIVNGRDVWFYIPADREATHADTGAVSDERFPFLFLLGQTNLRRAFRSITIAEDGSAASDTRTLRLVPRNNSGGLREVFLDMTTEGRILKVKMVDGAGAVSEISLRNVRENYVAPPESFKFNPPPGVTVRKQKP
ncbi:MAG TPA: outer membrane lipoprotein carrier protein LolA [Pyrinomonadaceae bacterium]